LSADPEIYGGHGDTSLRAALDTSGGQGGGFLSVSSTYLKDSEAVFWVPLSNILEYRTPDH
jgi:hypothetical protein